MNRLPLLLIIVAAFVTGAWLSPYLAVSAEQPDCTISDNQSAFIQALGTIADAGLTLRLIRDDRLGALRTYQGSRLTSAIEFASEYVDTFDQLEIPVPNLIEGLWKAEESIATGPDTERTLSATPTRPAASQRPWRLILKR